MPDLSTLQWRVIVAGRRIPCLLTRVHGRIHLRVPTYPHVQVTGADVADALQRAEAALRPILQPTSRAREASPDQAAEA
jgi:hypothetical protein